MSIFDDMKAHPSIGPILTLLDIVDPVDEFSKALVMIRDCFSPNDTLRELSRRALRYKLAERVGLMTTYETVVINAAKDHGHNPQTFLEAIAVLPSAEFEVLRASYKAQVDAMMQRPLP